MLRVFLIHRQLNSAVLLIDQNNIQFLFGFISTLLIHNQECFNKFFQLQQIILAQLVEICKD